MKVFLDTNVLASGLATRGLCSDVVRSVLEHHELVVSDGLLEELTRVLRDKFRVPADMVADMQWTLRQDALLGDAEPALGFSFADKDDIPILAAARNGGAELFVTGDRAVRDLGRIGSMRIVSPREFWDELRHSRSRPR